ncbi:MAG: hypothetical protein CVT63_01215 [Candidatus Anoxymicrobium japonicum]|uniref:Uncharacterized protein n=1 Tax=Candidatus Anoxymicrobium japonicum TaxID=2013648 RepID=A0A2N3G7R2_9ACTN|nr:MAG: hypothetical protein CVT63_01215 [Candidatus Anoxymicrobium japonicum]
MRKTSDGAIRYVRMSHYGDTYDRGVRIDLSGTAVDSRPAIGARADGNIYVAYTSKDPLDQGAPNNEQLCVRTSPDNGATWTAGYHVRTNEAHNHANPRFGRSDNGSLLLTYEDYASGHSEVYFREVAAGGWSGEIIASEGDATPGYCPSVCGFAANDYAIAYQQGDGNSSIIRVARYQSGAWTRATIVAAAAGHTNSYPDIVTWAGDRLCVVWNDFDGANSQAWERRFVLGSWVVAQKLYDANAMSHSGVRACTGSVIKACRASATGVSAVTSGADTSLMTGIAPFVSPRTLAWASDGTRSYLAVASDTGASGQVFLKRTDLVAPAGTIRVNGAASTVGGDNVYVKDNFTLSFPDVLDDWNVTGTYGSDLFTNGVTSIRLKYANDPTAAPGEWTDLPTDPDISAEIANAPWTCTAKVGSGLPEGLWFLKGTLTDTAGNTYDAVSGRVVVDTSVPVTSLAVSGTAGSNGWLRSDATCTLDPGDENPGYTEYRLENTTTGQKDSNWTRYKGAFHLVEGKWKVTYRSVDRVGNVEGSKISVVNVDTTAPVASIMRPDKGAIQTGYYKDESFRITGTGTDSNGLSWAGIYVDGKKEYETAREGTFNMAYVWKLAGVKEEANHVITVKVKDRAGNVGAISKNVYVGNVAKDWYFAEGNTLPEFDEWLCVLNPGDEPARYTISFMLENGEVRTAERSMLAHQRDTVRVKDYVSDVHAGVSVKIHSDSQAVVAERPIYFRYKQGIDGYDWKGGHNVVGVNTLQKDWYFAEGTTRFNDGDGNQFEQWLTILNPSDNQAANVKITYMLGTGQNIEKLYQVGPHSRSTVEVAKDIGINQDVSTHVSSDISVAVERPMYFNYHNGVAFEGSNVVGATGPSTEWSFAEGCTRDGYQEWITIQNPNNVPATCNLKYYDAKGKVTSKERVVKPLSRDTVNVLHDVGDNQDVSIVVTSDVPVICERPMYYIYGMDSGKYWNGGDSTVGNSGPSTQYFLAEGTTISNFDTYYTLTNPDNVKACNVVIEYIFGDGTNLIKEYSLAPHARTTINVRDAIQKQANVSGAIWSSFPIVIERPMYFDYNNNGTTGGHAVGGYGVD